MPQNLQILRTSTPGKKVPGGTYPPGTPWVNFADLTFGVVNASQNPQQLNPITYYTGTANYVTGALVVNPIDNKIYSAAHPITGMVGGVFDPLDWNELGGTGGPGGGGGTSVSVSAAPPLNPIKGNLWFDDSDEGRLFIWDGARWIDAAPGSMSGSGAAMSVSATSPSGTPVAGDMWLDTSKTPAELKIYDGSAWASVVGSGGGSGGITKAQADTYYYPRATADATFINQGTGDSRYIKSAPASSLENNIKIPGPGIIGLNIAPAALQSVALAKFGNMTVDKFGQAIDIPFAANTGGTINRIGIHCQGDNQSVIGIHGNTLHNQIQITTDTFNTGVSGIYIAQDRFTADPQANAFYWTLGDKPLPMIAIGPGIGDFAADPAINFYNPYAHSTPSENTWTQCVNGTTSDFCIGYEGHLRASINRSTGAWVALSDAQYKEEVDPSVVKGLSSILKLTPVGYLMNGHRTQGFIAQDVVPILSEAVHSIRFDKGSSLCLDYVPITANLVKAVQQLSARLEILEGN